MSNTPGERRPHSDAPRGRHLQTRSHIDRMNPVIATGSPPSIARSPTRRLYTVTGAVSRAVYRAARCHNGKGPTRGGELLAKQHAGGQVPSLAIRGARNCWCRRAPRSSRRCANQPSAVRSRTREVAPQQARATTSNASTTNPRELIEAAIFVLCLSGDTPRSRGSRPSLDIHHPAQHYGRS